MPNNIYIYSKHPLKILDGIYKAFQERFHENLEDLFSDDEMLEYEEEIESIAAVYVQPILNELTFEDFLVDPKHEAEQRVFFSECKSSLSIEDIPYLETNKFQVSYLQELISVLGPCLIDATPKSLQYSDNLLNELGQFKNIDSVLRFVIPVKNSEHPMDFLVKDVYAELVKMELNGKRELVLEELNSTTEKLKIVFSVMETSNKNAEELMLLSRLNPKDFGDQLERLKFFLRRIV